MTKEDFKKCFNDWFDEIRNYMSYRCCDTELATDIVQEAYAKLWEKKFEYEADRTKGLLYKIANNLWINQYRKAQSETKYRLSLSFTSGSNDTEDQYYYQELKEKYEKVLEELPEKRRTVFLMSRMDGLTYPQIAEHLEISVKAVEKRMKLALGTLRNELNHGK